jgi:hypothetical protein
MVDVFFCFREKNHAATAKIATPARTPSTIPVIAPPVKDLLPESSEGWASLVGVLVAVFVEALIEVLDGDVSQSVPLTTALKARRW